jgi:hypothetical protein
MVLFRVWYQESGNREQGVGVHFNLSPITYLHHLHYLQRFLIAQEHELTANGFLLLRCGTIRHYYSTYVLFLERGLHRRASRSAAEGVR